MFGTLAILPAGLRPRPAQPHAPGTHDRLGERLEAHYEVGVEMEGSVAELIALARGPAGTKCRGTAWDTLRNRPIDSILLTNATGEIVGFGYGGLRRDGDRRGSGWEGHARGTAQEIVAYAVDADGQTVHRLRSAAPR